MISLVGHFPEWQLIELYLLQVNVINENQLLGQKKKQQTNKQTNTHTQTKTKINKKRNKKDNILIIDNLNTIEYLEWNRLKECRTNHW